MERSYSLSCKTTIYIANLFVFEGINYVEHLYKNPNLQHQSFIYAETNYVQFLFFILFLSEEEGCTICKGVLINGVKLLFLMTENLL